MSRTLLLDIGNSRAKFAYADEFPAGVGSLPTNFLIAGTMVLPAADILLVSSVVPQALAALVSTGAWATVIVAGKDLPIPIRDFTPTRASTGSDRLLCLLAASRVNRSGFVISCGTALVASGMTYRKFIGGFILPGPKLMWEALSNASSALPPPPEHALVPPCVAVGSSTAESISKAIFHSTIVTVDRMVELMMVATDVPYMYITGGYASIINPHLKFKGTMYDNMVLAGLAILAEDL